MLTDLELLRYSRQILLQQVDIEGQLALKNSRALIVGLGGLGSPVALYLAAAGVGELHLADFDSVDVTNLQRQILHDTASVGESKVDSALKRLAAINPDLTLIAHRAALDEDSLADAVAAVDLVLDCCDNFGTREAVNRACVAARNRWSAVRPSAWKVSCRYSIRASPPALVTTVCTGTAATLN